MNQRYRCWAEIDRGALRHNAKVVHDRVGSAEMLAVVKANAYGHGAAGVAETLANDAKLFGVANVEEALALREFVPHPVVILGPATPEERAVITEHGFIPTISSLEEARDFSHLASNPHLNPLPAQGEANATASGENRRVAINFKIDTGMGRMGALEHEARELFKRVAALPHIHVHSVSSHMPVSNEDEEYTRDQLVRFRQILEEIRHDVPGMYKAHVLQSAGMLAFNSAPFDIVRAGIILYGISPIRQFQKLLKPAMTWKTRICLLRDMPKGSSVSYGRTFITPHKMRIATLSAGYADGYHWQLSNRGAAMLVRGRRCPLIGRVTMDLMLIDVSNVDGVQVGDEVVLMGREGTETVSCAELAEKANTIPWEIVTRIGPRVRRVFV